MSYQVNIVSNPSQRNRGALKFGLGLLIFIILAIIIYNGISFWSFRQG